MEGSHHALVSLGSLTEEIRLCGHFNDFEHISCGGLRIQHVQRGCGLQTTWLVMKEIDEMLKIFKHARVILQR